MPPAASIHDLPVSLLEAVFGRLKLHERQCSIRRVCWLWNEVVHSPALLNRVVVDLGCGAMTGEECVGIMRSLRNWLVSRAGPHVRHLELAIGLPLKNAGQHNFTIGLADEHLHAWDLLFREALAACEDADELALELNFSYFLNRYTRHLPHLRALSAAANRNFGVIIIEEPLEQPLVHLQFPQVRCLHFEEAGALPPSLTSLVIRGDEYEIDYLDLSAEEKPLQSQIGALSRLRRLTLDGCFYDSNECQPLQRISNTLTQLRWTSPYLPGSLPFLTALRSLTIGDPNVDPMQDPDFYHLEEALPHLAHLTQLILKPTERLPATLSALQQLSSLCIVYVEDADPLPAGGWLRSVRRLAANSELLAASLPNLGWADGLKDLGVFVFEDDDDMVSNLRSIVDWAAQQQHLQSLLIDHRNGEDPAAAVPLPPQPGFQHGSGFMYNILFPSDVSDDEDRFAASDVSDDEE